MTYLRGVPPPRPQAPAARRAACAPGAARRGDGRPPPSRGHFQMWQSTARTGRRRAGAPPTGSTAWKRNLRPRPYLLTYCSTARSGYCSCCQVIKQDDELDKLEEDIRKLKNKYDQFF